MKQTIDRHDFVREFEAYGRAEQLGGREGLHLLFDYLEDLESDTGEEMELDVIALCCDYACQTPEDIASDYGMDPEAEWINEEAFAHAVMEYLIDRTVVVAPLSDGRILYQQF